VIHEGRRDSAIQAAVAVADRLGMTSVTPVVLKDSNHTSIHLAPFPIVARVAASSAGRDAAALSAELSVAEYLARAGAPIIAPTIDLPPGPHLERHWGITLWQFVAHRPADEGDVVVASEALRDIHAALSSYPGQLPSFEVAIDSCRGLLHDETGLPALAAPDKDFLIKEHDRLKRLLTTMALKPIAIHGDPHLGNVLMASRGPRWTDWESACVGPVEWDLSCLPEAALAAVPPVNAELLAVLRDLRSACVAVWCWAEPDRAPEKRRAAEYHLRRLRERSRAVEAT
jgi:Ser/Thr protein kinase RdoA (MazF antagonist)